jgi:triosephosphate isomerase
MFGKVPSKKIHVVYGGSVKSDSSANLLALANVDGVLVGGGSLKVDEFLKIITSAPK